MSVAVLCLMCQRRVLLLLLCQCPSSPTKKQVSERGLQYWSEAVLHFVCHCCTDSHFQCLSISLCFCHFNCVMYFSAFSWDFVPAVPMLHHSKHNAINGVLYFNTWGHFWASSYARTQKTNIFFSIKSRANSKYCQVYHTESTQTMQQRMFCEQTTAWLL